MLRNCTAQQDGDFNPLPRKEGDTSAIPTPEEMKTFQSTPS